MRGRLIANMILQLLSSILFILFISNFVKSIQDVVDDYPIYNHNNDFFSYSYTSHRHNALNGSWLIYLWLWITVNLPTFIMGIVTLAMQKDPKVRGLTIASGILGILSGGFFSGFIVSLLAVIKTSRNSSRIEPVINSNIENDLQKSQEEKNIENTPAENNVSNDTPKNK